jgi:cytoskeletal protein RodZ
MGDWKNLPAPVFVRGFVAQTARILGLDEAKVATSYMKLLKVASGAKK